MSSAPDNKLNSVQPNTSSMSAAVKSSAQNVRLLASVQPLSLNHINLRNSSMAETDHDILSIIQCFRTKNERTCVHVSDISDSILRGQFCCSHLNIFICESHVVHFFSQIFLQQFLQSPKTDCVKDSSVFIFFLIFSFKKLMQRHIVREMEIFMVHSQEGNSFGSFFFGRRIF